MTDVIEIRDLAGSDAAALSKLLLGERPEYIGHFHPFAFDEETVAKQLTNRRRDRFWGFWQGSGLVGFFMMRGLDAGYSRPAFGICVAEAASGKGLARRALQHSLDWAIAEGVQTMILTVSEDNVRARRIYEDFGFRPTGQLADSGLTIYDLPVPTA